MTGGSHHEKVGSLLLGDLMEAAADQPRPTNRELRVNSGELALALEHLVCLCALDPEYLCGATTGNGRRVRKVKALCGELAGEGDRVATSLTAIDSDEYVREHVNITPGSAIAARLTSAVHNTENN